MMGKANFSDEFKRDAVAQITERGSSDAGVMHHLSEAQRKGEAPCLPFELRKSISTSLPLRELEGAAGFRLAVLLALDDAAVAG
jgi:hypothetical protein